MQTVISKRWGEGFSRAVGLIKVVRLDTGQCYAQHIDTSAQRNVAILVDKTEDLAGIFGFCPRAVSVYQELGIPVRHLA